jgi:hypothetical protein
MPLGLLISALTSAEFLADSRAVSGDDASGLTFLLKKPKRRQKLSNLSPRHAVQSSNFRAPQRYLPIHTRLHRNVVSPYKIQRSPDISSQQLTVGTTPHAKGKKIKPSKIHRPGWLSWENYCSINEAAYRFSSNNPLTICLCFGFYCQVACVRVSNTAAMLLGLHLNVLV